MLLWCVQHGLALRARCAAPRRVLAGVFRVVPVLCHAPVASHGLVRTWFAWFDMIAVWIRAHGLCLHLTLSGAWCRAESQLFMRARGLMQLTRACLMQIGELSHSSPCAVHAE